jgi:hypothetical protein
MAAGDGSAPAAGISIAAMAASARCARASPPSRHARRSVNTISVTVRRLPSASVSTRRRRSVSTA